MNNDSGNINNIAVLLYGIYEQLQEKEKGWYLMEGDKTDKSLQSTSDLNSEQFNNG